MYIDGRLLYAFSVTTTRWVISRIPRRISNIFIYILYILYYYVQSVNPRCGDIRYCIIVLLLYDDVHYYIQTIYTKVRVMLL